MYTITSRDDIRRLTNGGFVMKIQNYRKMRIMQSSFVGRRNVCDCGKHTQERLDITYLTIGF